MVARAAKTRSGSVPAGPSSVKDIVGSAASIFSIVSATAFVLSVIYEWAYFLVIGEKFRSIASLADYLANALDWLPATVASVIIGWLVCSLFVKFSIHFSR